MFEDNEGVQFRDWHEIDELYICLIVCYIFLIYGKTAQQKLILMHTHEIVRRAQIEFKSTLYEHQIKTKNNNAQYNICFRLDNVDKL
jgi:hypothetical protein